MKFLLFGTKGWLGQLSKQYLLEAGHSVETNDNDINSIFTLPSDIEVVINFAAKTNIDWCEKNKNYCFKSNVLGAVNLAQLCNEYGKRYVFISSACVFESKNLLDVKYEDSKPNPQCFYAETKAMAERLIQEIDQTALILRIRLPLSEKPHPRNTLNKLLDYDKINKNLESVTIIEDFLPRMVDLIQRKETGIFHLVNEGYVSPAMIAGEMGHAFTMVSKVSQDRRLQKEGRAKRVTAYVGSKRIPLLPKIKDRIGEVVAKFNASRN